MTRHDTTLGAWLRYGRSEIVEEPFDDLDIESEARTLGVELRQPIYRTLRNRLELALTAEQRESETFLLDDHFAFEEGTDDGNVSVSVLRMRLDWLYRDLPQVVAVRSQLSLGLDVLGATQDDCAFDDAPGSARPREAAARFPTRSFVAWLGQFQWVRRFDRVGVETVFRTDLQLAFEPLFSLEQFSLGGHQTVRGYRENQLVRDNGLASSFELRIPLWSEAATGIESAARSLRRHRPLLEHETAGRRARARSSSAGVGLRASIPGQPALRDLLGREDPGASTIPRTTTSRTTACSSPSSGRSERRCARRKQMGDRCIGKIAVVTGGSRGIGRGIALRLASEGADLALVARDLDGVRLGRSLAGTLEEIRALGRRAIGIAADLTDPSFPRASIIDSVEAELGGVDILINNAAMSVFKSVIDWTDEKLRAMQEVNVWAPWQLIQRVLPGMLERDRGWIVNISSGTAERAQTGGAAYGGTKAMLDQMTRCWGSS